MIRAAFFDIDGTLTNERTWKGMMDYFTCHRLRQGIHLAFRAVHYPLYLLRSARLISESFFRTTWSSNLAWYVRGDTPEQAQLVWDWAVENFLSHYWRNDTRAILEDHRNQGDVVMFVSAAPLPLVERIAVELGAHHAVGTRLELHQGRFTGRSIPPVVIDEGKASAVRTELSRLDLEVDFSRSSAYADSISDLALLDLVGNPVAVYPDQGLREEAVRRGWTIFPR